MNTIYAARAEKCPVMHAFKDSNGFAQATPASVIYGIRPMSPTPNPATAWTAPINGPVDYGNGVFCIELEPEERCDELGVVLHIAASNCPDTDVCILVPR